MIFELVPDPDDLLALEPEELAGVVLEYLNSLTSGERDSKLSSQNLGQKSTVNGYPEARKEDLLKAIMEAWVWLKNEGFLAPRPGRGEAWQFITRRGQGIERASDLEAYRHQNLLPKKLLHPRIAQKVWATFLRGDYDTAVFQSFKEVEVAVREAGSYEADLLGVPLMRKAFHMDNGPLRKPDDPSGEREALPHLFAGAIGSYKSPHSHRNVVVDREEAVEMIILASHLLKIVETRCSSES